MSGRSKREQKEAHKVAAHRHAQARAPHLYALLTALSQSLALHSSCLTHLDLAHCNLRDDGAAALARCLLAAAPPPPPPPRPPPPPATATAPSVSPPDAPNQRASGLRHVDGQGTAEAQQEEGGGRGGRRAVAGVARLVSLSLVANEIRVGGARALARGLRVLGGLERLDVSDNALTIDGALVIWRSVRDAPLLQVCLYGCVGGWECGELSRVYQAVAHVCLFKSSTRSPCLRPSPDIACDAVCFVFIPHYVNPSSCTCGGSPSPPRSRAPFCKPLLAKG